MYLPDTILLLGIFLLASGPIITLTVFIKTQTAKGLFIALACVSPILILGIIAVLCWKNQKIRVISQSSFEYTTFLGKTTSFYFSEITHMKKNYDSFTLFVRGKKIHIEFCAKMTESLMKRIEEELQKR